MYYEIDDRDIQKMAGKIRALHDNRDVYSTIQFKNALRKIHDIFRSDVKNMCVGAVYRTKHSENITGLALAKDALHCEHTIPIQKIYSWIKNEAVLQIFGEYIFLLHAVTSTIQGFDNIEKGCHYCFKEERQNTIPNYKGALNIKLFERYTSDVEIVRFDGVIIEKSYTIKNHLNFMKCYYENELEQLKSLL